MFCCSPDQSRSLLKAKTSFLEIPPKESSLEDISSSSSHAWTTEFSFDETRHVIGKAFAGKEKIAEWCLEPVSSHLSDEAKLELVTFIASFSVHRAFSKGCVVFGRSYYMKDRACDIPVSALVVREMDLGKQEDFWVRCISRLREILLAAKLGITDGIPSIMKMHKEETSQVEAKANHIFSLFVKWRMELSSQMGAMPVWHVNILGTDPSHQRKGIGSALMHRLSELADQQSRTCFLECATDLKAFYEQFGYKAIAHKTIDDPTEKGEPIQVDIMVRSSVESEAKRL